MKCIKCQQDSKYKDRSDGICSNCKAPFAFEPKRNDPFTDAAFDAAITRVSSSNSVRFTETNLFYELAKVEYRKSSGGRTALLVFLGLFTIVVPLILATNTKSKGGWALAIFAGGVVVFLLTLRSKKSPVLAMDENTFLSLLNRWKKAHGTPPKLIVSRPASAKNAPKALPKELAAYSFDRAVICDRPETVDLLLANNFHFENNCAVLSVTGYPHNLYQPVLEMLRRNPKIEVYALHDASAAGQSLALMLASSQKFFAGIGRVTDVGLSIRQAQSMRGLWKDASSVSSGGFPELTTAENEWLRSHVVELAAIRPEQLIKRLFRAMTQPGTEIAMEGGGFYFVGTSFGSEASTSDGGGDSFG